MAHRRLLILGGYGHAGRRIARLLLAETGLDLVLVGRNQKRAQLLADELNLTYPGERVTARRADAADHAALLTLFAEVDMVVVASSTAVHATNVASAALAAGIDYLDVQYSTAKCQALKAMAPAIASAGRQFITDGGFHPGLPAAMVRYAGAHLQRLHVANVASVIKIDWHALQLGEATTREFIGEFRDYEALAYRDGRWQKDSWIRLFIPRFEDFGPPFGRQYAIPMFLEEMRALPAMFSDLRETGFYVGSFNWFVDWLVSPILMFAYGLAPARPHRALERLMVWGLQRFSRPPFGVVLRLTAEGVRGERQVAAALSLAHSDGYAATAIPVVACLLQLLDAPPVEPGLHLQAHFVEPERFMRDLVRMGFTVTGKDLPLPIAT
jgi:saccharopine dehydrogenase (NAD+, L-lysine-forming)